MADNYDNYSPSTRGPLDLREDLPSPYYPPKPPSTPPPYGEATNSAFPNNQLVHHEHVHRHGPTEAAVAVQRSTQNRSLLVAAAGGVVTVAGAVLKYSSVAAALSAGGLAAVFVGGLFVCFGLLTYYRSSTEMLQHAHDN